MFYVGGYKQGEQKRGTVMWFWSISDLAPDVLSLSSNSLEAFGQQGEEASLRLGEKRGMCDLELSSEY